MKGWKEKEGSELYMDGEAVRIAFEILAINDGRGCDLHRRRSDTKRQYNALKGMRSEI